MLCDLLALSGPRAGPGALFLSSALPPSHGKRLSDCCFSLEARWEAHLQSDFHCLVAWGFLGHGKGLGVGVLLVLYYLLFSLVGGGCLGTPEIVHEPHRGEFSFPLTGPVLAPCTLIGEGVSGDKGKAGQVQDLQSGLQGALSLTALSSGLP